MTIEELEAKLAETTSKLETTTAKLEETTKHSREWENRAKANKAKADELEQLKTDHATAIKELDELKAYKTQTETAAARATLAKQISDETGVPADLLAGDDEESMRDYASKLDQYAHPKPQGLPNQGSQPNGTANVGDLKAKETINRMFDNL
ncbi:heavy metal transporter [Bifidobacterium pseudolongum]|uniref:heavy metal transporter n=1 Tax=Bifidobacterium pseudolongum TaxID=1694 RepID=UPI00101EFF17|nr:heavy metal transporter [Bifidobacterium pseudolongum]RYQ70703.1 heavy metal transporter [Bifidobacterium pseudolongum subsp. globosum]